MLSVINDILDFSKIESGSMDLDEHEFDLRNCVEAILDVFAESTSRLNLDLIYHIAENVPQVVYGDELRLRQVLLNLVGNSVKFTPQGEIVVDISTVPDSKSKLELFFSIRDTGIGIPEEKQSKLFKPFSQVDSGTTRQYGGSGLGLTISKKLIELMGGEINLLSGTEAGTTFQFNIQSKPGLNNETSEQPSLQPGLKNKRILIVDDNAASRTVLKDQCMQWGFIAKEAASGKLALDMLAVADDFDLVITDYLMPEMDGMVLAREIRSKHPAMRIILLSGIGKELSKNAPHPFNAALTKPVKYFALYQSIVNQLNKIDTEDGQYVQKSLFQPDFAKQYPIDVLIAEDNPINQKLVVRMLMKMGYEPDVAINGTAVLEALASKKYGLVFMDVQMPVMDGLETTRRIRQHNIYQPIIVAMTANAMPEDRELSISAGMDDYLSKPLKLAEIIAVLEKWSLVVQERTETTEVKPG